MIFVYKKHVLHYILATCVCKFSHACVASYTHVHASKISMRVFISVVCVSHTCGLRATQMGHACDTREPFKLWVICTIS